MKARGARWIKRALLAIACALCAALLLLSFKAASMPMPDGLLREEGAPPAEASNSVKITDRHGVVLVELRDDEGKRSRRLPLAELGEPIQQAIIAAEDGRFYAHPGLDPIAMTRAAFLSLWRGRVVSGASTLTQQLARNLIAAPRSVAGKLDVLALAVKLEANLPKDRILEEYLNRIDFGPNVRGVEAAAWLYFGKPAKSLSLGEAAALASIPRGPAIYDPTKNPGRVLERRDAVLDRVLARGFATPEEIARAKGEQLVVGGRFQSASAPHFVAALVAGKIDPCADSASLPAGASVVKTTLSAELQREIEQSARAELEKLTAEGVTAASVVVLANDTGEVLAYLGSPDAFDAARLGGNDGVRALRQPGSTLKPFIYELAMEELGMTPATILPDVEMSFFTADGQPYRPKNFDERFHGPVSFREALGNSLNLPAVYLTDRVGTTRAVERLRDVGFCSLRQAPSHYGVGVALGDGEVTLMELALAYATLARGGPTLRPRGLLGAERADGSALAVDTAPEVAQVLDAGAASFVTDILADADAREASFGESTVFDLPFDVAAKTGTSKGFRDNWAVGYTREVTVAVWVGNFDGTPMRHLSGIAGAGPLFRSAMLAAAKHARPTELAPPIAERVAVCPLSGKLKGPDCPHDRLEIVPKAAVLGSCDVHVRAKVDTLTGERAGPSCTEDVEERVFESYPPLLGAWARSAGRKLLPETFSARCPGTSTAGSSTGLRVLYPEDGAQFFLEAGRVAQLRARATFTDRGEGGQFLLDGRAVPLDEEGRGVIKLAPGDHTLVAKQGSRTSPEVSFTVE